MLLNEILKMFLCFYVKEDWEIILQENISVYSLSDVWIDKPYLQVFGYFVFVVYATLFVFSFYYHYNLDERYRRVKFLKEYKDTLIALYMIMLLLFHFRIFFDEPLDPLFSIYGDLLSFLAAKALFYHKIFAEDYMHWHISDHGHNTTWKLVWELSLYYYYWFIFMHVWKQICTEPLMYFIFQYRKYKARKNKVLLDSLDEEEREIYESLVKEKKEKEEQKNKTWKELKELLKVLWEFAAYSFEQTLLYKYIESCNQKRKDKIKNIKKLYGFGIYKRLRSNTKNTNNEH